MDKLECMKLQIKRIDFRITILKMKREDITHDMMYEIIRQDQEPVSPSPK